jgi:hypothetical protein
METIWGRLQGRVLAARNPQHPLADVLTHGGGVFNVGREDSVPRLTVDSPEDRGLSRPLYAATFVALLVLLTTVPIQWPLDDFAEYWAAGRLNAAGQNPYDPAAVLREEQTIGWPQPQPVMMYNPPWTLALAMPMGAIEFRLARSIWLPIQILITLWSASRLWILYGGAPRYTVRACCLALVWMPTLIALRMGQLSPVMLLGLVGFLWSLSRGHAAAAGAFFALTAVKPQLVALVWVVLLLWVIVERRWAVLAGVTACIVSTGLVALATNPSVFLQYQYLMESAPPTLEFESPNLATLLRLAAGTTGSWPQFVPTYLGVVGVSLLWYRKRATWEWPLQLPRLVLLSCLLTSYGGWAFDLVVLLVPIIATAALVVRIGHKFLIAAGSGVFLIVSSLAFVMHAARMPQSAFLWMTPAIAVACWALARFAVSAASRKDRELPSSHDIRNPALI